MLDNRENNHCEQGLSSLLGFSEPIRRSAPQIPMVFPVLCQGFHGLEAQLAWEMLRARAHPVRDLTGEILLGFKEPKLEDRRSAAEAAKKAMLEKFRAALQDPVREDQRAKRLANHNARLARTAEREAAKKATEAKLAAQAAYEAELANQVAREAEEAKTRAAAEEVERAAALQAEQKAARDARFAARKAAKKVRRRGY
jgi:hypothetical protein